VSLTPVPAHHNDDPSLHSFGNSFDMLSEADQFSFSDRGLSPAEGRRSRNRFHGIASPAGAFVNQDLKPSPTDTTDNVSLSDISPIKLVYHSNGVLSEARRADDGSLPIERHSYNLAASARANTFLAGPAAVSNPFYVLRCVQQAFQRCKYLLPCLREPDICPVNVSKTGPFHHYRCDAVRRNAKAPNCLDACNTIHMLCLRSHVHYFAFSRKPPSPSSIEVRVAERRVETAVCAFGGYLDPLTRAPPQDESSPSVATSIFRLRGDALKRRKYETGLSKRYTLSGSVVSWEVRQFLSLLSSDVVRPLSSLCDSTILSSKRTLPWRCLRRLIRMVADREAGRRDDAAPMDSSTTRILVQRRRRPIPRAIARTIAPAN
jgi:hypothetical protein